MTPARHTPEPRTDEAAWAVFLHTFSAQPSLPQSGRADAGFQLAAEVVERRSATDEGSYTFKFQITGPTGQKWTPTLVDGTQADFRVRVYQLSTDGNSTKTYLYSNHPDDPLVKPETETDKMVDRLVASSEPYYITLSALNADNVDDEVGLAISYDRSWSTDGSQLLLINGLTNNLKWAGSEIAEVIVIKQTEAPMGENESTND